MKRCQLFKLFKKLSVAVALALASMVASAGGSYANVGISDIWVYTGASGQNPPSGIIIVVFNSNGTGTPACSSSYKNYALIDLSAAGGVSAYAFAQTAYLAGKTVTVDGSGACSINSQFETLADIHW